MGGGGVVVARGLRSPGLGLGAEQTPLIILGFNRSSTQGEVRCADS